MIGRRALLRGLVGTVGLGLAAACVPSRPPAEAPAGDEEAAPATVDVGSERAAPAPTATPGGEPRHGGTLVYALPAAPDSLDPANALTPAAAAALRPLYDSLLSLGPTFQLGPGLAERWRASEDGLRYTFFLRRSVVFHDGAAFDARAAADNVERLLGPEKPGRRALLAGLVRAVRVLDDTTLELSLERPFAPLLYHVAQLGAAIVSPRALQAGLRDLAQRPVGTGPFRFADEQPAGRLALERWDEGWRAPPALDRLVFTAVPDQADRLAALASGEAQLGGAVSFDLLPRLAADESLAADAVPSALALGVAINTRVAPFDDRRVRQALNFAVDKDALVREVYDGQATPLGGPLGPGVRGAAPLQPYPFDPPRARQLLAQAGLGDGLEVPFVASTGRFPRDAALAQAIQQQLQAVGIKARLELLDPTQYTAALTKAVDETPLRLSLVGWLTPTGEARAALFPLFHSSQWMPRGQNSSFFKDARLDALLDGATNAADASQRDRLFWQALELLHDEAPWVYLAAPKTVVARSAYLHDPFVDPAGLVSVSEGTWLE